MAEDQIIRDIRQYAREMEQELRDILDYWTTFTPDILNGGFVGAVDNANIIDFNAEKGAVLNCRILWSFSGV